MCWEQKEVAIGRGKRREKGGKEVERDGMDGWMGRNGDRGKGKQVDELSRRGGVSESEGKGTESDFRHQRNIVFYEKTFLWHCSKKHSQLSFVQFVSFSVTHR